MSHCESNFSQLLANNNLRAIIGDVTQLNLKPKKVITPKTYPRMID
jgi:hypothetical protein